jgi:P27 family predicted phage terminase small subunit
MGRPRTPTNILKLKGSDMNHPGRLKARGKEPQPEKGQSEPPAWLSPRGRRQYRKLSKITAAMDVLTVSDHAALALLCDAWDDYWKAGEAVEQHGLTIGVQTREGAALVKANPAVAMKADAWRRVQSGLAKFGLQPKARDGITLPKPKEKNRFDDDW